MTKKIGLYKEKTCKGTQWRVRWFGNYDPNKGKLKRYSKTFVRQKDAEHFRKAKEAEFDKGTQRDPSTQTLKEYAEKWLHNKIKGIDGIRSGTAELYQQTFNRLYSYFGAERPLRTIDREAAKSFIADLQPMNNREGKFTKWSKYRILRNCKTLFNEAVDDGKIPKNPFDGISKGTDLTPSEWYFLKMDEYYKLLDVTPKLHDKVLYALCYTAGLRLGEALNLCWTDIDFDKSCVHIVKRKATETIPPFCIKGKKGRIVSLTDETLNLLSQLQAIAPERVPYVVLTKKRYEKILAKWKECQETGREWRNRYMANNILRNLRKHLRLAGIKTNGEKFSIHTLRKCCGKDWADNISNPGVVQNLMGHSSLTTTMKYYNKVSDDDLERAAMAKDKRLKEAREKATAEPTDRKLTFSGDFETNQDVAQEPQHD